MSSTNIEQPVVEAVEPVEAPVVETPVAPVPEFRHEYQPTDELGRPLGGRQVIVYKTPEELATKLTEQNVLLVRKLREVTKKQRLGITDNTEAPADVERFERPVDFKEKTLTPEEVFTISQELTDPAKFASARDRLLESAVGATPAELRKVLNDQQIATMQLTARANAATFMGIHPEFYGCEENLETLTSWMLKNGLAPTVKNFESAHQQLREAGLFLDAPIVREEAPVVAPVAPVVNTTANSQPSAEPVSRITGSEQPQEKRPARVPSGLNTRVASTIGRATETSTLTWAEVDKMPSDVFRSKYNTDMAFREAYNKLEAAQAAKKAPPTRPQ